MTANSKEKKRERYLLLIEDKGYFYKAIRRHLIEYTKFDVLVATSMEETKELLVTYGDRIFTAIADLHLPDAPHGEIVGLLNDSNIIPIVYTARFDETMRSYFERYRMVDFILKDQAYSLEILTRCVNNLEANEGTRVLVVDDSAEDRAYFRGMLENYKLHVEEAETASDAMALLTEGHTIRLVLIDAHMPDINGIELVRMIRESFSVRDVSVIGISDTADAVTTEFIKQGANDFVLKDFRQETFYLRVMNSLEIVRQMHELDALNALKNRFVGMAAHDLRNPLSAVASFTFLLLEEAKEDASKLDDDQKMMISYIRDAGDFMLKLIDDLLDFTKIESGAMILDLKDRRMDKVLERIVMLNGLIAKKKDIELDLQNSLGSMKVVYDSDKLEQVLNNLISNAIKYSNPMSKVVIKADENSCEGDSHIRIEVVDRGQGIPQEECGKLFDPFETTSVSATAGEKSTGLGLAIAKSIVLAHGGTIGVDSVVGEGSSFYFTLPLHH